MPRRTLLLPGAGLLLLAALGLGCHQTVDHIGGPVAVQPTTPPQNTTTPTTGTPETSKTPIKDALESLLADQAQAEHSPFPKGTRLLSVDVQDGVATVDLSTEFGQLANMGESTESRAQKALQKTLSRFPSVQKMRVTVEGKPFDSQATDWNTPFPVRYTERETSSSETGASENAGGRP